MENFKIARANFERFRRKLKPLIEELTEASGIDVVTIESRTKTDESFREKVTREGKKYDNPLIEVTDIVGVRIICYFNEDIDKLLKAFRREFMIDESASVDKKPRFNELGYISRHLIISLGDDRAKLSEYKDFKDMRCEVQIRTVAQHAWAAIEHKYNYKHKTKLEEPVKRRLFRIQAVLEICDDEFSRLRVEVDTGRRSLKKKIGQGESIKIYAESLIAFLDTNSQPYEHIFSQLRERGFRFRKRALTDHSDFAAAADRLRSYGIDDVPSFEAALIELDTVETVDLLELALTEFNDDLNSLRKQTDVIHFLAVFFGSKNHET